MVILTRIYTRTGDAGTPRLGDMSEVSKTICRLQPTPTSTSEQPDRLRPGVGELVDDVRDVLSRVQNELFDVGADFASPWSRTRVAAPAG